MKRIGFVVNPIAGMGGRVGLKGTDGEEIMKRAVGLGARPVSPGRAVKALKLIDFKKSRFYTCSSEMGEDELRSAGCGELEIVHSPSMPSKPEDTRDACRQFMDVPVDIILFCGGDGTARDILDLVGTSIPILGIPSGVKMHSAVFANDPESAAQLINLFADGTLTETKEAEVVDIDEEKYREGVLEVEIFGYARTISHGLVQMGKEVIEGDLEEVAKGAIAKYLKEEMGSEAYLVGPGTTTKMLFELLGLEKTLMGIDVIKGGELLKKDANEKDLLEILEREKDCRILISPIGAQGFLFGRGNQQLSSHVIEKVGLKNVLVVSTPSKLVNIQSLKVDTDENKLNEKLRGYIKVITGYHEFAMKKVE